MVWLVGAMSHLPWQLLIITIFSRSCAGGPHGNPARAATSSNSFELLVVIPGNVPRYKTGFTRGTSNWSDCTGDSGSLVACISLVNGWPIDEGAE